VMLAILGGVRLGRLGRLLLIVYGSTILVVIAMVVTKGPVVGSVWPENPTWSFSSQAMRQMESGGCN